MELVKKAEKALEPLFSGLPNLPAETRKALANIATWLALVSGVLQLLAAWWLYQSAKVADNYLEAYDRLVRATTGSSVNTVDISIWVWLGVAVLVVDAIILLVAFPKLKAKMRSGWDLLFLGALVNVVYGVLTLFVDTARGGFGSLVLSLLASAVGFYLLFQVKGQFTHGEAKQ